MSQFAYGLYATNGNFRLQNLSALSIYNIVVAIVMPCNDLTGRVLLNTALELSRFIVDQWSNIVEPDSRWFEGYSS